MNTPVSKAISLRRSMRHIENKIKNLSPENAEKIKSARLLCGNAAKIARHSPVEKRVRSLRRVLALTFKALKFVKYNYRQDGFIFTDYTLKDLILSASNLEFDKAIGAK